MLRNNHSKHICMKAINSQEMDTEMSASYPMEANMHLRSV